MCAAPAAAQGFTGTRAYVESQKGREAIRDGHHQNAAAAFALALAIYPKRTITIVVYTQEQFRDVTRSPRWAAAAYDGRIRLPVR